MKFVRTETVGNVTRTYEMRGDSDQITWMLEMVEELETRPDRKESSARELKPRGLYINDKQCTYSLTEIVDGRIECVFIAPHVDMSQSTTIDVKLTIGEFWLTFQARYCIWDASARPVQYKFRSLDKLDL